MSIIKFDVPIDGVLHVIEHPMSLDDQALTSYEHRPLDVSIGQPHWRLAFVQQVEKLRTGSAPQEPRYGMAQAYHREVKGTFTTVVYGMIEPVESALATAKKELDEERGKRWTAENESREHQKVAGEAKKKVENVAKEIENLAKTLESRTTQIDDLIAQVRRQHDRIQLLEKENKAVREFFGVAQYNDALKGILG